MLANLSIKNYALIDKLNVAFEEGFTCITGETGAGKSIIVGALNMVLGERAASDAIRQNEEKAEVEALFELRADGPSQSILMDMGIADPDGALVVRRVLSRTGRNRLYLNGHLATLTDLRRVVTPLVDISSQHAQTSLLKESEHRVILDRHGRLGDAICSYQTLYGAWRRAEEEYRALQAAESERAERIEFLRFQLSELDELDPQVGEDIELANQIEVYRHSELLRDAAEAVENTLEVDQNAVLDRMASLPRLLSDAAQADPSLEEQLARLESVRIELADIAHEARHYRSRIDGNADQLAAKEERLDRLRRLMRRHGPELEHVIAKRDSMAQELKTLDSFDDRLTELQTRMNDTRREAESMAHRLSAARTKAAKTVTDQIEAQLADLSMPDCRFVVRIDGLDELNEWGRDRIVFLLGPNVGEDPKPLARIASGGELSRIMLAIKHVLADTDAVDCYVFDEVDAGVSGGVAEQIGVKLRETAMYRQVICITHLPQVACHASQHLRVYKETNGNRTTTHLTLLSDRERQEEVARLLAGVRVTDKAREHAGDLIRNARVEPSA